jgi:hypothetical protein
VLAIVLTAIADAAFFSATLKEVESPAPDIDAFAFAFPTGTAANALFDTEATLTVPKINDATKVFITLGLTKLFKPMISPLWNLFRFPLVYG